ncbi:alpha/beta hydrolase [Promicromonospora sukumoe]|uniref:alpha/beta hydrolase n=1 Tax=Promicromonospora sukumoe TaxID=88382 RepID=UPI0003A1DC74|nr:alpha/beta hydrolase-fold protein [Promicromonospora sukumoe]
MAMESQARPAHPVRRGRRALAAAAAAAAVTGAVLVAPPAAADAVSADPWVSEVPGNPVPDVFRFTVPRSAVTEATGIGSGPVAVQGNFGPGKAWTDLNMGTSGSDLTATLGPLEPGLYYYQYAARPAVDQDAVAFRNPAVPQEVTSKPTYSTMFVPGPGAEWLDDVADGGELATLEYGKGPKHKKEALVWTPPGYDADRAEQYPVLYLLQDEGQSYREWVELGRLGQIMDNLTLDGDAEPMVVVMGDAGAPGPAGVPKELLPAVERAFNVSHQGSDRAIAGIGRGGEAALSAVVDKPRDFANVGSFSAGYDKPISRGKAKQINDSTDVVRLYAGNVTDPAYDDTVALADRLTKAGVRFQPDGSDPETGGTWDTWQKNLHDFAGRIFQEVDDEGPSQGHLPFVEQELPPAGTTPTPWIDENGVVTFELGPELADANNITVWGNFGPAGSWPRTHMVQQDDGSWRLSLAVEGGSYYYKFVVDGVDRKDAGNPTKVLSEPTWSTFTVEGDTIRGRYTSEVPAESRGDVSVMTYPSTAGGGTERSAYVWTPPDYDADRAEEYPVFYLQHGGGQTWTDWVEVGYVQRILDNHYLRGDIVPMVVVMANGNGVDFPTEITTRIVPAAEDQFNVSSRPDQRALAGLSMGSGHTLSTLWAHPGEFGYIGAMSAFGAPPANADVEAINEGTKLLRVYSGDVQDFTYGATLQLIAAMEDRGVNHEFAPIVPGPHSWDVWQKSLIDFLPRLFTEEAGA